MISHACRQMLHHERVQTTWCISLADVADLLPRHLINIRRKKYNCQPLLRWYSFMWVHFAIGDGETVLKTAFNIWASFPNHYRFTSMPPIHVSVIFFSPTDGVPPDEICLMSLGNPTKTHVPFHRHGLHKSCARSPHRKRPHNSAVVL